MMQLDSDDIPPETEAEYVRRLRIKHTTRTGPLGDDALIDMLRSLGYEITKPEAAVEVRIDWHLVPEGTEIEAKDEKGWRIGAFGGVVDDGLLVVLFPGDDYSYEFPRHNVRLADVPEVQGDAEDPVVPSLSSALDDRSPDIFESKAVVDPIFASLEAGHRCFVELDGDIVDGEFVEIGPGDHELSIYVDGELHRIPEKNVTLAD